MESLHFPAIPFSDQLIHLLKDIGSKEIKGLSRFSLWVVEELFWTRQLFT